MECFVCETKIEKRDSVYWEINEEAENRPLHSDCLIRWAEFSGEHEHARQINALDLAEGINRGQMPIL
jgi:hypothetical protein